LKRTSIFVAAAILLINGCDAWFYRRIDITTTDASFAVAGISASRVVSTVRQYADARGLRCNQSDQLPIDCMKTPIRVWAFSAEGGAVVCYGAIGTALERAKFEGRMNDLEKALVETFGIGSVSSKSTRCPSVLPGGA
jgi:hypothetical protein